MSPFRFAHFCPHEPHRESRAPTKLRRKSASLRCSKLLRKALRNVKILNSLRQGLFRGPGLPGIGTHSIPNTPALCEQTRGCGVVFCTVAPHRPAPAGSDQLIISWAWQVVLFLEQTTNSLLSAGRW